jgi:signal transduction histidine kinase
LLVLGRPWPGRGNRLVLVVAVIAAIITALVYGIPPVLFAYPLPGAASFASAVTSMSALSIAILFALRAQRSRRQTDHLVAALFGAVALLEGVLPIVAEPVHGTVDVSFWARVIGRTLVGLGLCVVAWLPERTTRRRRWTFGFIAASSVVLAGVVIIWTFALIADLPGTVGEHSDPGDALVQTQGILGFRLVGAVLLLGAVVGLVRKGRRQADPVFEWLACGAVLMATARFHDYLFPSMHYDWVTTGDLLRIAAFLLIGFGLLRELGGIWRRRVADARAHERRALAAELHDGLAQELAFLTTQSALAERDPANGEHLARIRAGAERALSETRLRISEYADDQPVALDLVLAELGEDARSDFGCEIRLDLEAVSVGPRTAHELRRVTREALFNAVRHGHPEHIVVQLKARDGRLHLSVFDNGCGIADAASGDRFGLTSMRERAERLGGHCSIESVPRSGTLVAIEVPER